MTPQAPATVGGLLDASTRRLAGARVPDARREAVAILAHALGTDRGGVLARRPDPVPETAAAAVLALVLARAERRPLQHLTGVVEFEGLVFDVSPDVLIPRPETEGLVEAVFAADLPEDARVADLGTGSGCIAVTLSAQRPGWRVVAVDRSEAALTVARRNAARHGVEHRIEVVHRDFGAIEALGPFDAIVSNPPYVSEEEWRGLEPEVRDHEPRIALVPGPTGLEAYEAIARVAAASLRPGGLLALELGHRSEEGVSRIVLGAGLTDLRVIPDVAGIARVLLARKPSS